MQSPSHSPTTTTITTTTNTNNNQETSTFTTRSTTTKRHLPPQTEHEQHPCPRCHSPNTKFCYYNNYNTSQPRHFCKSCRRYWTHGGTLRDIPVGGGTRKNAKRQKVIKPTSGYVTTSSPVEYRSLAPPPPVAAAGNFVVPFDGNGFMSFFGLGGCEHGVWPFSGGGCDGGHGGVHGGREGWQVESGGEGGGERFVMPELAISTPGYAMKTEYNFVMPELAISTPSYVMKTEDKLTQ